MARDIRGIGREQITLARVLNVSDTMDAMLSGAPIAA
jgi:hypothetical protein